MCYNISYRKPITYIVSFTDLTTCECKPVVSTCSAIGTTGGMHGKNS